MKPFYENDGVTIYHGDCLNILAELELSIDAVVMDPPFASGTRKEMGKASSGAMLRAGRFADRPIENDQMTTQGFVWLMRAVGQIVRDMLPDGGSLLSFIDWRQWPNLVGALETLICHASKGVPLVFDRSCGDVLRYSREPPTNHPSPKPEDLMRSLINVVTEEGGTVLDPFMGGGTTLRAAKDIGRKAIGIEFEEKYCEIAADRLSQGVLF